MDHPSEVPVNTKYPSIAVFSGSLIFTFFVDRFYVGTHRRTYWLFWPSFANKCAMSALQNRQKKPSPTLHHLQKYGGVRYLKQTTGITTVPTTAKTNKSVDLH
jgi:hypothetical protein